MQRILPSLCDPTARASRLLQAVSLPIVIRRRPHVQKLGHARRHRGNSLVGILVSMAIIVVLFAVLMSGLNTAVTGSGNTTSGSVRSMEDQVQLRDITISCFIAGQSTSDKGAPTPSQRLGSSARSADTTANLYALLIAERYVEPRALISSNERNPMVGECGNYDYREVDPASKRYWDSKFTADLVTGSNVSYAHVPLFGTRAMYWTDKRYDTRFPILGTRAPANGSANPQSLTYGRDGTWAGFQAFGDGHVDFVTTFVASGLQSKAGSPDNAYALDDGPDGNDACLAFTNMMYGDGPRLQWD